MRYFSIICAIFCMWISNSTAIAQVITCGDVMAEISNTAKDLLHKSAQERAQADYEAFMEKKLETPYIGWPDKGTPESMAATIELYWCETRNTPLHTAYYRLYTSYKKVYEK